MNPIDPGHEHGRRIEITKEQEEYSTLVARTPDDLEGTIVTRWQFSDEERRAMAAGADVYLRVLTFGRPLQPLQMSVCGMEYTPDFGGDWSDDE